MISSKPFSARGVRLTPTTLHAEGLEQFADRRADDAGADDHRSLAVQRTPQPPRPDAMLMVLDLARRIAAHRHHHIDDLLAHRRAVNAAAAGDENVGLERRAAQEMIDPGRQRLNPFHPRRTGEHVVAQLDAEHDHDVDVGEVARHLRRAAEQCELQVRKFRPQSIAIHFGVDVDDKNFCHALGSPKYRAALLKATSSRSPASSGT